MLHSLAIKVTNPICKCKITPGQPPYNWSFGIDGKGGHYLSLTCKDCKTTIMYQGNQLKASIEVVNIPKDQLVEVAKVKEEPKPKKEKKINIPSFMKVIK